jgi:hypothetical protein
LESFLFADGTFRKERKDLQRTKGTYAFALSHETHPSEDSKEPFFHSHIIAQPSFLTKLAF